MDWFVLAVFVLTYAGMAVGRVPGLGVDRAGIALLAAIALQAGAPRPRADVLAAIDFETLGVLFALMVVSLQFSACGFHDRCAHVLAQARLGPRALLALVVAVGGALAAVLTNDVVALALTPVLARGLIQRGLDPRPYLLGLAGALNAGSAASLIGNPQNILIAQHGTLGVGPFVATCAPPAVAALVLVWAVTAWVWRGALAAPAVVPPVQDAPPPVDRWGLAKGMIALGGMLALFLTPVDRATAALLAAGLILTSRRLQTRAVLGQVDWPLLVLFASLFVVVDALAATGTPGLLLAWARDLGLDPLSPGAVLGISLVGSNTIGNVPLVTGWLAVIGSGLGTPVPEAALYQLSVYGTLAGNLLLIGSLANLIVADQAAGAGVRLGFLDHARAGIPMTLLGLAAAWVWFGGMG
ncbi:SLC13 family permease [Pararhodospirillum oryzae]|uniref:Transporter n=1 Tax=Pararhodospirillum oryzae TaxID=478448 RepID=A0A512H9J2_9PROT|nr:SLC13 family permease [Pararhodospirillum oryzae]GEO82115.1 transporter [Pararhodospirillum oryzae]